MSGQKIIHGLKEAIASTREVTCYSCARPYEWGPDLVVSDADWARIEPPQDEHGIHGILCPNCMNDAFEALGVPAGSIEAAFTSGPFANLNWKKPRKT